MVRIPVLENRAVRCGAVRILSSRKPAVRFGADFFENRTVRCDADFFVLNPAVRVRCGFC